MADVFLTLAHGPQGINKLAVVKRLRNAEDPAMTKMFFDEACLAARFNHPNVVDTYEMGEGQGEYFIAMEYLEGQPLSRLMKTLEERHEGLPEPLLAFIAIQALKGLHYAHEFRDFDGAPLGVVHRDVSPHNLFVTYDGRIKLLDFGIAKITRNGTHTEDGVLKGKVRYMAPEQAWQGDVDRRADIYAFAVILWELLARRPLHTGAPLSILTRVMTEDIPSVCSVRSDASPALDAIVLKAARRNRDERYATAEEMRLAIEAYLREQKCDVSERELACVMNDRFARIREDVRASIKDYVASMPPPQRGFAVSTGMTTLTSTGKLPILPSGTGRTSAASWTTAALPSEAPSARELPVPTTERSSRPWAGAITISLFIAAAALALFAIRSPNRAPIEETAAPPLQPAAPANAGTDERPDASPPHAPVSSALPSPASSSSTSPSSPSALPPPRMEERRHARPRPLAPSPAASPPEPPPSAAPSAPLRPNIRMLDERESS